MPLMIACGVLVLIALALITRWHGQTLTMPAWQDDSDKRPSVGRLLRAYLWLLCLGALSGVLAGLLVVGPGGRLAMRLLAVTSPEAQGRITEAGEVVGEISADGTIGLFIFVGLLGGPACGVLYVLLHRALPGGLLGGMLFGLLLLVVSGARLDPLRPENPDFAIVGPGWLAVALFALLAIGTGAFLAAAAGPLSKVLPLPGWRAPLYVLPLALFAVPSLISVWPAGLIVVAGGVLFVLAGRFPLLRATVRERGTLALRVAIALVVLALLPGFASAVVKIAA